MPRIAPPSQSADWQQNISHAIRPAYFLLCSFPCHMLSYGILYGHRSWRADFSWDSLSAGWWIQCPFLSMNHCWAHIRISRGHRLWQNIPTFAGQCWWCGGAAKADRGLCWWKALCSQIIGSHGPWSHWLVNTCLVRIWHYRSKARTLYYQGWMDSKVSSWCGEGPFSNVERHQRDS